MSLSLVKAILLVLESTMPDTITTPLSLELARVVNSTTPDIDLLTTLCETHHTDLIHTTAGRFLQERGHSRDAQSLLLKCIKTTHKGDDHMRLLWNTLHPLLEWRTRLSFLQWLLEHPQKPILEDRVFDTMGPPEPESLSTLWVCAALFPWSPTRLNSAHKALNLLDACPQGVQITEAIPRRTPPLFLDTPLPLALRGLLIGLKTGAIRGFSKTPSLPDRVSTNEAQLLFLLESMFGGQSSHALLDHRGRLPDLDTCLTLSAKDLIVQILARFPEREIPWTLPPIRRLPRVGPDPYY